MKDLESKKTEKFKAQLLYIDKTKKERLTNSYHLNIEQLNAFILECEILLKKQLTKKQINSVLKNPVEFSESVKESIKNTFQFPNATIQWNMDSLGLSFDKLESTLSILTIDPSKKYLFDGNKVIAEPKQLNEINSSCEVYTINKKQNELFEVAKHLKNASAKLMELKFTYSDTMHHFVKASNRLIVNSDTSNLEINHFKILEY